MSSLMRKLSILVACISLFVLVLTDVPTPVFAADYSVQQWRTVEIGLTSSKSYTDPFNDVDVTATFTGPGANTITRPAFWDGGSTWKIRFAPTVTGNWSMTTTASDTTNSGLHNVTKSVQVSAYTGTLDIYKHGFLKASTMGVI